MLCGAVIAYSYVAHLLRDGSDCVLHKISIWKRVHVTTALVKWWHTDALQLDRHLHMVYCNRFRWLCNATYLINRRLLY